MCGRYTLRKGFSTVAADDGDYSVRQSDRELIAQAPRYNIAPTQKTTILRKSLDSSSALEAVWMRWGLIPSWTKNASAATPMINARSETVAEKPAYRAAFQRRRCLVPADGFYEWKKRKNASIPFFFSLQDDSVFHMAGIWETWLGENGEVIDSYTILTTHANSLLAKFHDRMPVILRPNQIRNWLEGDVTRIGQSERNELFSPLDSDSMTCHAANPIVNNNRSDGPECLEEPEATPISQLDLDI